MRTGWQAAAGGAAVTLLIAGCASAVGGGAGPGTAKTGGPAGTSPATAASASAPAAPPRTRMWFSKLMMATAADGWALYSPDNPATPNGNPGTLLARSTDGARTWTDVTPPVAVPVLRSIGAADVLYPVNADRAYLSVTAQKDPRQPASTADTSMVFATTDGGRTWTESAPITGSGGITMLSFTDAAHGWVVVNHGAAMGRNPVQVYRTADGGRHWSMVAASPPMQGTGTSGSGIPIQCDKTALAFPATTTGWLTSACVAGWQDALLVSRDGGATWAPQQLPVPSDLFGDSGGEVIGPQFTGSTGFVTLAPAVGGHPVLLASQDLGASWHQLTLPSGAGQYPQVRFFSPTQGILVPMASQGLIGGVFYTTADGGQTWTPVVQGTRFTQLGAAVEFTSPQDGVAWFQGGDAQGATPPPVYVTANSGRTWASFSPKLAG